MFPPSHDPRNPYQPVHIPLGGHRPDEPMPDGVVREPGSRPTAWLLWAIGIMLYVLLVVLQQEWISFGPKPAPPKFPAPDSGMSMMGQIYIKMFSFLKEQNQPIPQSEVDQVLQQIEHAVHTPEDAVRMAILAGELSSHDDAIIRLEDAELRLNADSPIAKDLPVLFDIFGGKSVSPESDEGKRLIEHHGYFGKLALSQNKPNSDPLRQQVIGGGPLLLVGLLFLVLLVVGALLAGVVILIFGGIQMARVKLVMKLPPSPRPAGSIGIEMFVVFIVGFLMMKIAGEVISQLPGGRMTALPVTLGMQWLLALVIFYPVLRGMRWRDARQWLGLHSGTGLFREIGAGIVGYLACVPLLLIGVVLALILAALSELLFGRPPQPENDIVSIVGGAPWWLVMMLGALALLWAPVVEETVFRGALFRECRVWTYAIPAGIITAFFFAFAHGYPFFIMPVLMSLATGFAMIRLWRSSLIACIVAHGIHNTFALGMMVFLTRVIEM